MSVTRPGQVPSRNEFEIAIICALKVESDAVEASFDEFLEKHGGPRYEKAPGDQNSYHFGRLAGHNTVIAYMPHMGKVAAATTAATFRSSFPNIRLGLVVGICAGVPRSEHQDDEIFLGDVIISTSVIQYDFGRQFADKRIRKDTLEDVPGRPSAEIRAFLHQQQGWRSRGQLIDACADHIKEICAKRGFGSWQRPPLDEDKLYRSDYRHKHREASICEVCANCTSATDPVCEAAPDLSCKRIGCENTGLEPWFRRRQVSKDTDPCDHAKETVPNVHFGRMATGDSVIKSSFHRDDLADKEKVIGFEMEGAGVWDQFPTIIVKGVCDYGDSHKDKRWQKHASVAAAACAKALLQEWRTTEKGQTPSTTAGINTVADDSGWGDPPSRETFVFNNKGKVGNQAGKQVFNGPTHFGSAHYSSSMSSGAPNYGSQVEYNAGTINNNDHRQ